jgi:hypothetical protein
LAQAAFGLNLAAHNSAPPVPAVSINAGGEGRQE